MDESIVGPQKKKVMRTGLCQHCGKKEENHFFTLVTNKRSLCDYSTRRGENPRMFLDSGLARLHENSEELFEAAVKLMEEDRRWGTMGDNGDSRTKAKKEIYSIIQKITSK